MIGLRLVKVLKGDNSDTFSVEKRHKNGWKSLFSSESLESVEKVYRETLNPIKDNRLVNGITFAIRFKHFLEGIQVCDAASEEELEYLQIVADELLNYQKETVEPDSDEERYLKNNNVLPK